MKKCASFGQNGVNCAVLEVKWALFVRIQPARRPQGKKAPKRLDVSKLNKDSMRQDFLTDICNQLDAMNLSSEDPEENWTVFHKTVLSSAASTLGHPSRKHQDWFDENDDEIQRLLAQGTSR